MLSHRVRRRRRRRRPGFHPVCPNLASLTLTIYLLSNFREGSLSQNSMIISIESLEIRRLVWNVNPKRWASLDTGI